MIFITGATGGIGSALCRLLAEEKIPARAMCRKQEQLQQFATIGLDAALADFNSPESLKLGMQGCDKLFLLTPPDEDHVSREMSIISVALAAGVKHIVRLSTADTNLSAQLPYGRTHAEVDHFLREQPVSWTVLRPTGFMQNIIESGPAIVKGMLPHMLGDGQISYIDSRDIASVAKTVLAEEKHNKAVYYLTGPESLMAKTVASQLTAVLGFEIKDIPKTEAEMRQILTYAGLSEWYINALVEQFKIGANGGEIDTTEEVERLTGKAPRTFIQFAMDHKKQFLNH